MARAKKENVLKTWLLDRESLKLESTGSASRLSLTSSSSNVLTHFNSTFPNWKRIKGYWNV